MFLFVFVSDLVIFIWNLCIFEFELFKLKVINNEVLLFIYISVYWEIYVFVFCLCYLLYNIM